MTIREVLFLAADVWMIASGFTYGVKFIRHYANYLLGLEWIVVATSGTNFLVYSVVGASQDSTMYHVAYFLDAFSRSIGITLILVLGLMKVTHHYKPSAAVDVAAFALAAVVGFALSEFAEQIGTPGKIFYIVVNVLTSIFLIYFAKRLWDIAERGHAVWVLIATAAGFITAAIYDFVHIPGDDAAHTLFYIFALSSWGLQLFAYYRGYRALDTYQQQTERRPEVGGRARI